MGVGQKGLRDWLIQRLSAVVLAAYTVFLMGFFIWHPNLDYATWQGLFTAVPMQVATMLVLLSLVWHAWIGLWTVCTDYINCVCLRLSIEALIFIGLLICFFWGIYILWSI